MSRASFRALSLTLIATSVCVSLMAFSCFAVANNRVEISESDLAFLKGEGGAKGQLILFLAENFPDEVIVSDLIKAPFKEDRVLNELLARILSKALATDAIAGARQQSLDDYLRTMRQVKSHLSPWLPKDRQICHDWSATPIPTATVDGAVSTLSFWSFADQMIALLTLIREGTGKATESTTNGMAKPEIYNPSVKTCRRNFDVFHDALALPEAHRNQHARFLAATNMIALRNMLVANNGAHSKHAETAQSPATVLAADLEKAKALGTEGLFIQSVIKHLPDAYSSVRLDGRFNFLTAHFAYSAEAIGLYEAFALASPEALDAFFKTKARVERAIATEAPEMCAGLIANGLDRVLQVRNADARARVTAHLAEINESLLSVLSPLLPLVPEGARNRNIPPAVLSQAELSAQGLTLEEADMAVFLMDPRKRPPANFRGWSKDHARLCKLLYAKHMAIEAATGERRVALLRSIMNSQQHRLSEKISIELNGAWLSPGVPRGVSNSLDPALRFEDARKAFVTSLRSIARLSTDGPAPEPPADILALITYKAPLGENVAYMSTPPDGNSKLPALIIARSGFGGIGEAYWTKTPETLVPLQAAKRGELVLIVGSWRGDNDNPGRAEDFMGEVDDALALVEHVRSLPYVDADRVYMLGHSTGGTLTLLTSLRAQGKLAASFAIGGQPDLDILRRYPKLGESYNFATDLPAETYVRSFENYVSELRIPSFAFDGELEWAADPILRIEGKAQLHKVKFFGHLLSNGDHFNIVEPVTKLIVTKILEEAKTGIHPPVEIVITDADVLEAAKDLSPSQARQ